MNRQIFNWLTRLSDPRGLNANGGHCAPFPSAGEPSLSALLEAALRHNVRPAVTGNLTALLQTDPVALLAGEARWVEETAKRRLAEVKQLRQIDVGRAMLLAHCAREILAKTQAAGLPVVLVKGADFAENAYGGLAARTFSDVDLLVRPDAEPALAAILSGYGYQMAQPSGRHIERPERQWTRPDAFGGITVVDVHTDMVHAPDLRSVQTLTYDLYAGHENGGVTPAARLILAGLHGATSHLFGRLQYVVDGMMIARTGVDPVELRQRTGRTGALLPVATMLRLASELYECADCRDLLSRLGPVPWSRLERNLITPSMVLSAKDNLRFRFRPQRHLYRRLMQINMK